jgi:hypothetical protein
MWKSAGRSWNTWRRTKILRHGSYGVLFTDRPADRRNKRPPPSSDDHASPRWLISGATPHSPIRRW